MEVFRRKDRGKVFYADLWSGGKPVRFNTKLTNRRLAQEAANAEEKRLKEATEAASNYGTSLKLKDVGLRYMNEVGSKHSGSDNTERLLTYVIQFLGETKLFTDIKHADAVALMEWREKHKVGKGKNAKRISAYTVNDTVEQLKKLFTFLKKRHVVLPKEPLWDDLWLKLPIEHIRELSDDESVRLHTAMQRRPDYIPLLQFMHLSTKRKMNCIGLKWTQVKAHHIEMIGKGGKTIRLPITPEIRAIIEPLRGHHPVYVFTFVAARTVKDKVIRHKRKDGSFSEERQSFVKGERYPITKYGFRKQWEAIRAEAGLVGEFRFRIHDFRHDLATKVLRKTGNLKLVSKMLDHASVATTQKYAHVNDDDIAAALSAFAQDQSAARVSTARGAIRAVTTTKTTARKIKN